MKAKNARSQTEIDYVGVTLRLVLLISLFFVFYEVALLTMPSGTAWEKIWKNDSSVLGFVVSLLAFYLSPVYVIANILKLALAHFRKRKKFPEGAEEFYSNLGLIMGFINWIPNGISIGLFSLYMKARGVSYIEQFSIATNDLPPGAAAIKEKLGFLAGVCLLLSTQTNIFGPAAIIILLLMLFSFLINALFSMCEMLFG